MEKSTNRKFWQSRFLIKMEHRIVKKTSLIRISAIFQLVGTIMLSTGCASIQASADKIQAEGFFLAVS